MLYVYGALAGVVTGATYSLVALSITLMYRSTGVLSFAHAAFATVAAYVYADLAGAKGWAPLPACAVGLAAAALCGVVVERFAIRPVSAASATVKLITTLGVLSVTSGLILMVYGSRPPTLFVPLVLPEGAISLGRLQVTYQELGIFVLAGAAALGLAWFLDRTRFGIAIRAVAQNAGVARLMGVSIANVARFNWILGAVLAGLAGILMAPFVAALNPGIFTVMLVKAMTASLVGGLMSLPLTFVGGLGVGVAESITTLRSTTPGARELVVLLLVLVLLFARRARAEEPDQSVGAFYSPSFLAVRLLPVVARAKEWLAPMRRAAGRGRLLVVPVIGIAAVVAVVVPAGSEYWGFIGARALVYLIVSLSIVLLVGWAGQVSIMHGAYVGIGAFATSYLVDVRGYPLELAIPLASLVGMAIGAMAGLPALRLSGLQFAIASIAMSAAASSWLFLNQSFTRRLPRETLFGIDLFDSGNLYLVMLPIAIALYVLAWNLRRSAYGPLLLASRDSPRTVEHFGASARRTRMATFVFASFTASLGGAFYGILLTSFQPTDFGIGLSISFLLYAVVCGVESLGGPILVALLFGVLPALTQGESGTSASTGPEVVSGILVIVLLAARPAGLASLLALGRTKPPIDVPRTAGAAAAPNVLGPSRFETVLVRRNGHAEPAVSDGFADEPKEPATSGGSA